MVHFLFEDNEKSPISTLLLASSYGKNMHFSCGNDYLRLKISSILKEKHNDFVLVFMDCPPNREDICSKYEDLCMIYDDDNRVKIFPIICIEEIVLKMLNKYYVIDVPNRLENLVENTIVNFDWSNVDQVFKDNQYVGSSLEHVYKYIVSQCKMRCFHNINGSVEGKFYISTCDCEPKYCQLKISRDDINVKAEKLYTMLPIFIADDVKIIKYWESLNIHLDAASINSVYDRIQDKFDIICDSMGIDRINVCRG